LSRHNMEADATMLEYSAPKLKGVSACQPKTLMLWSF
jgi:hypothetical protein